MKGDGGGVARHLSRKCIVWGRGKGKQEGNKRGEEEEEEKKLRKDTHKKEGQE